MAEDPIEVLLARLDERIKTLQKTVDSLEQKFDEYTTRHEFTPVRLLVYGITALIISSVIAAIVAQVVH